MKKKLKSIKFKKERVILSDILPYEIPITFSNRHLYDFIVRNKIKVEEDKLIALNADLTNQEIIKLMFGIKQVKPFINGKINFEKEHRDSIPFGYRIVHKINDYRELSIIHPKNQIGLIEFYDKYKDLILYYCNISPYSIRKPYRIAKHTYHKDKLHFEKLADASDEIIEVNDKEYENLKTYFVYKKYSNIHKFYESYQYHRCEKKYNRLFKFDISKCFDSIYTHSICWALLDKNVVKKFLTETKSTFGNIFDTLMHKLNYNETNGIIIGPEFSRIYAEIILQQIDLNVKRELDSEGIFFKKDYEIFRYVDDFFVFYNDEPTKEKIFSLFRLKLKDFKLYLNDQKSLHYDKPIITEITIAKQKINDLINKYISYDLTDIEIKEEGQPPVNNKRGSIYINSNKLTTKFKTIIFESQTEYKDVLNYTFSLIERKLQSVSKNYFKIISEKHTEKQFIEALLELLDFVFFLYSVSPRVNTTIKLSRILRVLTEVLNLKGQFNVDLKHLVFKKIYDNIYLTLQKNKSIKYTQVETLYLLIALSELGKEYWLSQDILSTYLGIAKDKTTGNFEPTAKLNYFAIVVTLFYMKNKVRYNLLRVFIEEQIVRKFEEVDYEFRIKTSELTLLLFDTLSCPHINMNTKRKVLDLYQITSTAMQNNIIASRKNWFTNWTNFNFGKELDSKSSQEVY